MQHHLQMQLTQQAPAMKPGLRARQQYSSTQTKYTVYLSPQTVFDKKRDELILPGSRNGIQHGSIKLLRSNLRVSRAELCKLAFSEPPSKPQEHELAILRHI